MVGILTETYLLQSHRKKFRIEEVFDATSPFCYMEDEDLVHMMIQHSVKPEIHMIL